MPRRKRSSRCAGAAPAVPWWLWTSRPSWARTGPVVPAGLPRRRMRGNERPGGNFRDKAADLAF